MVTFSVNVSNLVYNTCSANRPSKKIRKHRSQSPFRDVSPVPSHFSEPASCLQHRDVIASLPCLPGIKGPLRDEDDDDDVRSHKSLPAVMTGLTLQPREKRSYRHSKNHITSSLPPLISARCSLFVRGTGCKTVPKLPPITKSSNTWKETDPPRPPCRSGCRPDKMEFSSAKPVHAKIVPVGQTSLSVKVHSVEGNGPCLLPAKASGVSPKSRLTFQSPVEQAVYPISPDTMQQMRQTDRACQPLRSVLKKAPNGGVFDCPLAAHLLEPFSGFQEHLCRQILHSPLPYCAALPQVHIPCHQDQVDLLPAHRGPYGSLMERTVELCNSQGQKLPKITMTRPTPSPKYLCRTESWNAA
uniref:Si:dkey-39a18.1 n=1 Tax=Cyprinus carpio TaxID=7962 RepID=A0A8C1WAF9_CYPCA